MKYIETIPDPRVLGRCKYRLCDILYIVLAIYVFGGEDYTDMHEYALDGKTIRGSKKHKGSTHILSAWVSEHGFYTALSASDTLLDEDDKWANLQSLVRVERKVYNKSKQEEHSDIQYYISSLPASQVQRIA